MQDSERYKLHGTYHAPKCKVGGWLKCRQRGKVQVVGITDAPIPWPYTERSERGGRRILIFAGDLVKAVQQESSLAIRHHWGVCISTVWQWRKLLGIKRTTKGTVQLHDQWVQEIGQARKGEQPSPEVRQRMSAAQKKRLRPLPGASFDPEFVALLGTMPDREVAERTGINEAAVVSRRRTLKIPAFKTRKPMSRSFVWTDEKDALLGTMPDNDLAQKWGVTWMKVFYRRRKLGIAAFRRHQPEKQNDP